MSLVFFVFFDNELVAVGHVCHVCLAHVLEACHEDGLWVEDSVFDHIEELVGYLAGSAHGLILSC